MPEPLSPYQLLALAGLVAFVFILFRSSGRPKRGPPPPAHRSAQRPAQRTSLPEVRGIRSPEAQRLHAELLSLVYGDEKLVKRLVDFERRTHGTREASYRAAIHRLLRDRSN